MNDARSQWVPKVHPATRPVEEEDPMTLHAVPVGGDPEVMLQCVVQEYAWMGWDAEMILGLFRDRGYPVLGALLCWYGEDGLRERLRATLRQTGVFRYETVVAEEPDVEPEEPELIQVGIRPRRRESMSPEGSSHAEGL